MNRMPLLKLGFAKVAAGLAAAGLGTATGLALLENSVDVNSIGAVRILRAGVTVAEITADYKWSLMRVRLNPASAEYRAYLSALHLRSAEKLKDLCCKNGGAFVKVGQHLGSLDYLLPPEYVETMRSLFRDAPQSPFEDVLGVLQEDLKQSPWDIFSVIDKEPLGAASLAQVHRAVLHDGSVVAVKVQHPKVEEQSRMDVAAMEVFLKLVAKVFPDFQFIWLAEETKKLLPLELDFVNEGRNCERMGDKLRHFSFLKVPKIHWRYSTKRVLMMEYCEGGRVDDLKYYEQNQISPTDVYCKISQLFTDMIFKSGYVHCDPHPGNMLVSKRPDGRPVITLLDHGIHLTIPETIRLTYAKLWLSMLNKDVKGMQKHSEELGVGDLFDLFACMLTARSWKSVTQGVQSSVVSEKEMEEIKVRIGSLLFEITDVLNRVPREVLLILKTNDLLRGLSYKLKVYNSPCNFTNTSLACTKVVYRHKLGNTRSLWRYFLLYSKMCFMTSKIRCYEFYLKFLAPPSALVF